MIPVLLRLGPITIYSYGLMMALGFITADFLLSRECRRREINPDFANAAVVWAAISGIAGSRIYDIFDNWSYYMSDPWSMVFSGSGFVWYGGLIGGIISTIIVARRYNVRLLTAFDMCASALILGQAWGRMGCQLSGDGDWGLPSTLPWAMAYPHAIVGWNARTVLTLDAHNALVSGFFPGVRVHPAPIYEVILYTAIFCLMWSMRKQAPEGRLLALYLILAGFARFMVEFVRINPRVLFGLSEAQIISVVMIVSGVAVWYLTAACAPRSVAPQAIQA
jgi:phosphatidylglycerol---prolipoprotein diacylglyceryl transferase